MAWSRSVCFPTPRSSQNGQCVCEGGHSRMLGGIEIRQKSIRIHRIKRDGIQSERRTGRGDSWSYIESLIDRDSGACLGTGISNQCQLEAGEGSIRVQVALGRYGHQLLTRRCTNGEPVHVPVNPTSALTVTIVIHSFSRFLFRLMFISGLYCEFIASLQLWLAQFIL